MALGEVTSADELLVALLDRVVQQMFAIGLRLRSTPGEVPPGQGVRRLADHLDRMIEDIRTTVMSWQCREAAGVTGMSEIIDEVSFPEPALLRERAVAHLRVVSEVRPLRGRAEIIDGGRWVAINHAVHGLHAAIAVLRDEEPDGPRPA